METKEVIRTNRLRLGLTEQQLADRVGVSRGSVQQWEAGKTAPKRGNQDAVAAALGINKALLMGMQNETQNLKLSGLAVADMERGLVPLISSVRAGTWGEINDHMPDTQETFPVRGPCGESSQSCAKSCTKSPMRHLQ